ncbi:hypothetical protein DXT88_06045 [Herbaspirillum lusitanum]|uniref:hypothetical protein n=1 Tax=Herbaspirillum lusitanum TaxID=213312 RepID=UPI00223718A9|nr:hypothetical protein [Herbaspirillum lusitanum]MCW5297734.1 hypothetical protein [Herbaspirillum lusitanum]
MENANVKTSGIREFQLFVVDGALTVAGILSVAGGLWSIYRDNAALAATCMAAGLILLFAATLHRFELLKGFGIEAKMKKLDDTIDKAEVALAQLKDLTKVTSVALVTLYSRIGRTGGPPTFEEEYETMQGVKRNLLSSKYSLLEISAILRPWIQRSSIKLILVGLKKYDSLVRDTAMELTFEFNTMGANIPPELVESYQEKVRRSGNLTRYNDLFRDTLWTVTPDKLEQHIRTQISGTPELSDQQKRESLAGIQIYLNELLYFHQNLEALDMQFWLTQFYRH